MGLGGVIRGYRARHGLSLREFAKMCDLSHTYIAKLEEGVDPRTKKPVEPTIETVNKVALAMAMPLDELLRISGYMSTSSPRKDVYDEKGSAELRQLYSVVARAEELPGDSIHRISKALDDLIDAYKPKKGS
ncbi:MAG: helix-turn-helix transcriptional regulator [Firmicutes bacterium]|nr:helix-turn-helix transcriptional regulator [Bacillota bacterium]